MNIHGYKKQIENLNKVLKNLDKRKNEKRIKEMENKKTKLRLLIKNMRDKK